MPTRKSVTVRVPATSANLGPGFDCLGMALDIWNEVRVETVATLEEATFDVVGEGAAVLPRDDTNYVVIGLKAAFEEAKVQVPHLRYHCVNNIPFGRGLGSSSAAAVAGLLAGIVLSGLELEVGNEALLQLAAKIEGHPDNAAPAIYGGIQIGLHTGGRWYTSRVSTPQNLACVVFIPNYVSETSEARKLLPDQIPRADAVFNLSRTALFVNAIACNRLDELSMATEDALHQPARMAISPHLTPVIQAALDAGAKGAFLSGAGPSVMAFTTGLRGDIFTQRSLERCDDGVAKAMLDAAKTANTEGRAFIATPTDRGAHIVCADPPFSDGSVQHWQGYASGTACP